MMSDSEPDFEDKVVHELRTVQSVIDNKVQHLVGLRTQCATTEEVTQMEIRDTESKLIKLFSRLILVKRKILSESHELHEKVSGYPKTDQWLSMVGLNQAAIEGLVRKNIRLEILLAMSDDELRNMIRPYNTSEESIKHLTTALKNLKAWTEKQSDKTSSKNRESSSNVGVDLPLNWTTYDNNASLSRLHGQASNKIQHKQQTHPRLHSKLEASTVSKDHAHKEVTSSKIAVQSEVRASPPIACRHTSLRHSNSDAGSHHQPARSSQSSPSSFDSLLDRHSKSRFTPPSTPPLLRSKQSSTPPLKKKGGHATFPQLRRRNASFTECNLGSRVIDIDPVRSSKKTSRPNDFAVPESSHTVLQRTLSHDLRVQTDLDGGLGTPLSSSPLQSPSHFHQGGKGQFPIPTLRAKMLHQIRNSWFVNKLRKKSSFEEHIVPKTAPSGPYCTLDHRVYDVEITPDGKNVRFHEVVQRKEDVNSPKPDVDDTDGSDNDLFSSRMVHRQISDQSDCSRYSRAGSIFWSLEEWDIPFEDLVLGDPLGTGRFGTVYKGNWHGDVAVKMLNMDPEADNQIQLAAFKLEVSMLKKTRHENLVLFMGACMKPPHLGIVTSLCRGHTLYNLLHMRKDKLSLNRAVLIAQQIAQGMGYLHAKGIVHKDLKTKNVFLEKERVIITDFGLFNLSIFCQGRSKADLLRIPPGWLCYLAPEIIRSLQAGNDNSDLPFTGYSDVYAFGTVWYELLCGEWPFRNEPAESIIWKVGRGIKQALGSVIAAKEMKTLLMSCWTFRAKKRPSFSDILQEFVSVPRQHDFARPHIGSLNHRSSTKY